MIKKIDEIAKDVWMLIDENEDNEKLITDTDEVANDTQAITEAMVLQSVDFVHMMAPVWRVSDIAVSSKIGLTDYKKGKAGQVPADFLKMVSAEASDWPYRVYLPIDQNSDEYEMQASPFAGIRGSAEKPVVAIVPGVLPVTGGNSQETEDEETEEDDTETVTETSGLIIEAYTTNDTKLTLQYIKKAAEEAGGVTIADKCYVAVLNMIAKYYMINVGDTARAQYYESVAAEQLGLSTNTNSE